MTPTPPRFAAPPSTPRRAWPSGASSPLRARSPTSAPAPAPPCGPSPSPSPAVSPSPAPSLSRAPDPRPSRSSSPAPDPVPGPRGPRASGPQRSADAARRRRPPPVRLVAPDLPSPARPGEDVAFARVSGRALGGAGVRHGDHVFLRRTRVAPDGALAAVVDRSGRGALWRVRHDRDALALYAGGATRVGRTGPWPEVTGVVVGILRKFDPAPP